MIVIDLDSIKTDTVKQAIIDIVHANLAPTKEKNIYVAKTPIYWMSKTKHTLKDLEALGYPVIGTVWAGNSVVEMLQHMVKKTDEHALKIGLGVKGKFRAPVNVYTDKDFPEIEALNATPRPVALLESIA